MTDDSTDAPFIHHPDKIDDDPRNGLVCFMQMDRPCGPDCMAFSSSPPEGRDYFNQQWAHCSLLVNAHRVGKHVSILAVMLGEVKKPADVLLRALKKEAQDRVRTAQTPPPVVG
jgi:hypothetical protein